MGWIYTGVALVAGALFTFYVVKLLREPTPKRAMTVFSFSITYLSAPLHRDGCRSAGLSFPLVPRSSCRNRSLRSSMLGCSA